MEKTEATRSRHNSYDLPKSFELAANPPDFIQMEQVQKLKEHVGSLVQAKVILVIEPVSSSLLSLLTSRFLSLSLKKLT